MRLGASRARHPSSMRAVSLAASTSGKDLLQQAATTRRGDRGSELPRLPSVPAPSWAAGSTVEVAWSHKAWHGGGYQYRLCPVGQTLSEACFQALPLPFADNTSMLRWGGAGNPSPNPSPNTRLTLTLGASRTLTLTLRCDGSLQARWTVQGLRALVCCGRCERGRHRA